jgi:hypothetical protein
MRSREDTVLHHVSPPTSCRFEMASAGTPGAAGAAASGDRGVELMPEVGERGAEGARRSVMLSCRGLRACSRVYNGIGSMISLQIAVTTCLMTIYSIYSLSVPQ